jgi:DNA-binding protein YbaB
MDGTTFSCDSCGRVFNFKASLSRHKKSCDAGVFPVLPVRYEERDDDAIKSLQKRCDDLQTQMEHIRERPTMTNTYINSNNNKVTINALGREDLTGITPELVETCIRRTTKGLAELMEKIHFDTSESNHNLRASLQHPEQVEYHDGGDWKYGPKNRVVRQVVDSSHSIVRDHYDDNQQVLRNTVSNAMYDFIDRWMNKMTRSTAQVYMDVMSEVYCTILNRTRDIEKEVESETT